MTRRTSIRARTPRPVLVIAVVLATAPAAAQTPSGAPDPEVAVVRPGELACAPRAAWSAPTDPIRLIGSEEGSARQMYGPGDAVVVEGGIDRGLEVGQEYFVRRQFRPVVESPVEYGSIPNVVHTAGWLRIVDVEQTMAIAVVSRACDAFLRGDYLVPFAMPEIPTVTPVGDGDYAAPARILFAEDGRLQAGVHRFMVIDRGRNDGIVPGQRFTIFRDIVGDTGPVTRLGEAFAVLVDADSATIRLFATRDAVLAGDRVAPHR